MLAKRRLFNVLCVSPACMWHNLRLKKVSWFTIKQGWARLAKKKFFYVYTIGFFSFASKSRSSLKLQSVGYCVAFPRVCLLTRSLAGYELCTTNLTVAVSRVEWVAFLPSFFTLCIIDFFRPFAVESRLRSLEILNYFIGRFLVFFHSLFSRMWRKVFDWRRRQENHRTFVRSAFLSDFDVKLEYEKKGSAKRYSKTWRKERKFMFLFREIFFIARGKSL